MQQGYWVVCVVVDQVGDQCVFVQFYLFVWCIGCVCFGDWQQGDDVISVDYYCMLFQYYGVGFDWYDLMCFDDQID